MEREKVFQMTNDYGKSYVQKWLKNNELLGTEVYSENTRNEFFLIHRYPDGCVAVCVLPIRGNSNDGCCSFGGLNYFAQVFAHEESGISILWNPLYANRMVWPNWRNDLTDTQKDAFFKKYHEIMEKYS